MRSIPGKNTPINIIIHSPKTKEGQCKLADRVAGVHANFVNQYIQKLNCPSYQKMQLLDAVIQSALIEKAGEQTP